MNIVLTGITNQLRVRILKEIISRAMIHDLKCTDTSRMVDKTPRNISDDPISFGHG